jgi:hypothetical protein
MEHTRLMPKLLTLPDLHIMSLPLQLICSSTTHKQAARNISAYASKECILLHRVQQCAHSALLTFDYQLIVGAC